jgi:lipopolysaccharide/colanic/teichoic acid biosynthesis glycosyltransferase
MYRLWGKRIFDIAISGLVLIMASPLLFIVALALWWVNHGDILFYQIRPGLGGVPFRIIKFKTMTDERGADGALLPDNERITPLGRIVRALSIDELLQLINDRTTPTLARVSSFLF